MPPRDPLTFPKLARRLPTLNAQLRHTQLRPYIGVTQGGSSRDNAPAKIAATDGRWRPADKKWS